MSVRHIAWAWGQKTGSGTRKAVLVALADHVNRETLKCCPPIELLAEETELSKRTVQTALADLCDSGLISRERQRRASGALAGYDYVFPHLTVQELHTRPATDDIFRPATDAALGEPGTSLEPVEQDAREVQELHPPLVQSFALTKVDRVIVTVEHAQLAVEILGLWNMLTEQSLSARDWLAKITMRIREHPDLSRDEHEHVIRAALAAPWWTGPPTPSVVYGNGAQFERSIVTAQKGPGTPKRRYGIGMTGEEILAATQGSERDEG